MSIYAGLTYVHTTLSTTLSHRKNQQKLPQRAGADGRLGVVCTPVDATIHYVLLHNLSTMVSGVVRGIATSVVCRRCACVWSRTMTATHMP